MPYASEKQRRFMYAKHPEIAKRWDKEGKNYIKGKKKVKKGGTYSSEAVRMAAERSKNG